jgi:hypothetical protein
MVTGVEFLKGQTRGVDFGFPCSPAALTSNNLAKLAYNSGLLLFDPNLAENNFSPEQTLCNPPHQVMFIKRIMQPSGNSR